MSLTQIYRWATGDAPDTATGGQIGSDIEGLENWQIVQITAQFAGNTGGTLDVYVQRWDVMLNAWVDYVHFAQAASGAASATYTVSSIVAPQDIYTVGTGTSPALAADTFTGGHPGDKVRVWSVSGAGTSAGATVKVSFHGVY